MSILRLDDGVVVVFVKSSLSLSLSGVVRYSQAVLRSGASRKLTSSDLFDDWNPRQALATTLLNDFGCDGRKKLSR